MNFTYPKKRKLKKSQSDYYLPNQYLNILRLVYHSCLQVLSDGQKKKWEFQFQKNFKKQ
jgi:hypothetical protein